MKASTTLLEGLKRDFDEVMAWSKANDSNKNVPPIVHAAIAHYLIDCDKTIRKMSEELE